jgi:flagellar hook-length control protein FliK
MAQTLLCNPWQTIRTNQMLELTQLLSGSKSLASASEGPNPDPAILLQTLLQGDELTMGAFSGEMQALLLQLPPQVMQRLEQLIGSGMNLPQAANRILGERFADGSDPGFAELLKGGQGRAAMPGLATPMPSANNPDNLPLLPQAVPLRVNQPVISPGTAAGIDLATMAATPPPPAGSPAAQPAGQLPPQLAGSLLQMGVPQQVGSRAWEGAISDRVMWMIQGEQQVAKLKLNPPNLGPLEIRVTVNQDQTTVAFLSQQAAVREALEAALPRLREMFDQQQLQLVRADVSDPGAQHGDRASGFAQHAQREQVMGDETDSDAPGSAAARSATLTQGVGMVDLFA